MTTTKALAVFTCNHNEIKQYIGSNAYMITSEYAQQWPIKQVASGKGRTPYVIIM